MQSRKTSLKKDETPTLKDKYNCETPVLWKQYQLAILAFLVSAFIGLGISAILYNNSPSAKAGTVSTWSGVSDIRNISDVCTKAKCRDWDALVVLGGGPGKGNVTLPLWTQKRLDVVLDLYECCSRLLGGEQTLKIITTSAGTAHGEAHPLMRILDFRKLMLLDSAKHAGFGRFLHNGGKSFR